MGDRHPNKWPCSGCQADLSVELAASTKLYSVLQYGLSVSLQCASLCPSADPCRCHLRQYLLQTSQYLGLDIRQPTTIGTRILGISIATPTLTALVFIYSIAAYPIKTPKSGDVEAITEAKS